MGPDSSFHVGEGRSHLVILLLSEPSGQVMSEPVQMLADDPADLLVARGPVPGVRWRSAGRALHARQGRRAECLVQVREQPGPSSQVGEELVEQRMESIRLGDPSVSLPDVQDRVNDLVEHLVEGSDRIVARGRADPAVIRAGGPGTRKAGLLGYAIARPEDLLSLPGLLSLAIPDEISLVSGRCSRRRSLEALAPLPAAAGVPTGAGGVGASLRLVASTFTSGVGPGFWLCALLLIASAACWRRHSDVALAMFITMRFDQPHCDPFERARGRISRPVLAELRQKCRPRSGRRTCTGDSRRASTTWRASC